MQVVFGKSHMDTLTELYEIAKKHGGSITFGTDSDISTDLDEEVLKENGFTDELIAELKVQELKEVMSTCDRVWFELVIGREYHTLTYRQDSTYFYWERDNSGYFYREEPTEELIKLCEEKDDLGYADRYSVDLYYQPTIIYGFGAEPVKDFRVYRSGMALKFFADLVCDYLGEPRIDRVY